MVKAVDKAIREAGLGLNPQTEGQVIRVPIPDLNEERRRELTKVAAKYAEQARVSVRNVRRDGIELLRRQEKDGEISQDQQRKLQQDIQRLTDDAIQARRRDPGAEGQGDPAGLMRVSTSAGDAAPRSLPRHVAIIMDGNGRWAQSRGLPRIAGHRRGAEAVRRTVAGAVELGIPYLTLFGFSSENWKRPSGEIDDLMGLLRHYLLAEIAELHRNGIRLRVIGQIDRLAPDIVPLIENAETLTRDNTAITLTIALSYGGRAEIAAAVQAIAAQAVEGSLAVDAIDEDCFARHLFTVGLPDPDLLIRTSGEQRISNFLLWQCAYSELVFTKTLWPDFGKSDLEQAIDEFRGRERRYGAWVGSR